MEENKPDRKPVKRKKRVVKPRFFVVLACFLAAVALLVFLTATLIRVVPQGVEAWKEAHATPVPTPTPTPTPAPTPTPLPYQTPHPVSGTGSEIYGMVTHIEADGQETDSFEREESVQFSNGEDYAAVQGVLSFRGNNYRDNASFGTADLTEYTMTKYAEVKTGSMIKGSGGGNWSGCGWTGQPLIVKWDEDVRKGMKNMYETARAKFGLVEVIYPTEAGKIFFLDLETGQPTRDPLDLHMPFKGTGAVDPRGWPLLYVGTGDEYPGDSQKSRAMIISLIDGTRLYEFGVQDTDSFAKRDWYAYDSAPLVNADTDTLIWPGENGVVYTMKLNTVYNQEQGVISVKPSGVVKFRYDSARSYTGIDLEDSQHKWLGYEGSAAAWRNFLYLSSNDGLFQCINLDTMELVWVADTLDDTNASPVLDIISDDEAYLYVGTSLHFTKDGNGTGRTPFYKINALTGEIAGQYTLTCETVSGVSGGVQDTCAIGRNNLEGLVYVAFARYGGRNSGVLVALDKNTMTEVWHYDMADYSWSSPVIVYDSKGDGVVLEPDNGGHITMLDGKTGEVKGTVRPTETAFEASMAVYEDKAVIGCRGDETIFFLRLS